MFDFGKIISHIGLSEQLNKTHNFRKKKKMKRIKKNPLGDIITSLKTQSMSLSSSPTRSTLSSSFRLPRQVIATSRRELARGRTQPSKAWTSSTGPERAEQQQAKALGLVPTTQRRPLQVGNECISLFYLPWKYPFLPCCHPEFESAITAQNDEFKGSFDSSSSRLLNVKS